MDKYIPKLDFGFETNQSIAFIDTPKGKWNAVEKIENIFLK